VTQFFFEKEAGSPVPSPVMPAQAGIHDFFAAAGSNAFVTLTEKSWMPAFAGMTGKGFNRLEDTSKKERFSFLE
jgi:hypothetical protein